MHAQSLDDRLIMVFSRRECAGDSPLFIALGYTNRCLGSFCFLPLHSTLQLSTDTPSKAHTLVYKKRAYHMANKKPHITVTSAFNFLIMHVQRDQLLMRQGYTNEWLSSVILTTI